MHLRFYIAAALMGLLMASCKKDKEPTPTQPASRNVVFKFRFDSTQQRLNNIGQPATIPTGNAAQSPVFNTMSAHYVELAPDMYTPLGQGDVLYRAPETTAGGSNAIDFSQSVKAHDGEVFLTVPIDSIAIGTYEWLRVSLAYQNYDIKYKSGVFHGTGTIASFIGFNTYVTDYIIKTQSQSINGNKAQGFWGFETPLPGTGQYFVTQGQAPAGATTVPNPIASTSPIPAGSCVVTAAFDQPLVITGNETSDIVITVSVSTNKSFEWQDNGDGFFEPSAGDAVVDMGVRGIKPVVQ